MSCSDNDGTTFKRFDNLIFQIGASTTVKIVSIRPAAHNAHLAFDRLLYA